MTGTTGDLDRVIESVRSADIVVGITACRTPQTAAGVVRAALSGLEQAAPGTRALILVVDSSPNEETENAVLGIAPGRTDVMLRYHAEAHRIMRSVPYHGNEGRKEALRAILETSQKLGGSSCLLLSGDLMNISPDWIARLLDPILHKGFDYVAPLYQRRRYEGTLSQTLLYPLMHAVYGKSMRQPLAGEAAFSGTVVEALLQNRYWDADVLRPAADLWMSTAVVSEEYRICQTVLDTPLREQVSGPVDVSDLLVQLAGAAFTLMDLYHRRQKVAAPADIPLFGTYQEAGAGPASVNTDALFGRFRIGVREFMKLWSAFLTREVRTFLQRTAGHPDEALRIPDDVWAEIVFSFALAHHRKIMNQQQLLQTLTPLYLGKTASFVRETGPLGPEEFEAAVENICRSFGEMRYFLKVNWGT